MSTHAVMGPGLPSPELICGMPYGAFTTPVASSTMVLNSLGLSPKLATALFVTDTTIGSPPHNIYKKATSALVSSTSQSILCTLT